VSVSREQQIDNKNCQISIQVYYKHSPYFLYLLLLFTFQHRFVFNVAAPAQQHLHKTGHPHQVDQGHVNLSTSTSRQNVDRTFAELQPSATGAGGDATEVCTITNRFNHQQGHAPTRTIRRRQKPNIEKRTNGRQIVKQELPCTPSFPNSFIHHSVRPGPSSVSEVPSPVQKKVKQTWVYNIILYLKWFILLFWTHFSKCN